LIQQIHLKKQRAIARDTKEQPEEEGEWIEGEFYPASSFQTMSQKI